MANAIIQLDQTEGGQSLRIAPPAAGLSLQGRIRVPGDKSISHRALMLGAIASGTTQIQGLLLGEDPRSTAACLGAMGATISDLTADTVTVTGTGLALQEPADILDAGNSGTTMRLMLGLLASQPNRFFTVTGDSSLRSRPMKRVIEPLRQMGASIWCRQGGFAPLAVQGRALNPIEYQSPVASAQVKSCILLAGLGVEGTTTVTEPLRSRDHSERMLAAFGAKIEVDPEARRVAVTGPAQLSGQSVVVPGDISSAAFWLVAAAITPGADLVIENVGVNPTRTGILEVLQEM
ncbi:MAG: 3-phosphoshikimate 1-carboxyvinyltransferase, partial [Cyanobacteria bacterium P01_A01_bin.135]